AALFEVLWCGLRPRRLTRCGRSLTAALFEVLWCGLLPRRLTRCGRRLTAALFEVLWCGLLPRRLTHCGRRLTAARFEVLWCGLRPRRLSRCGRHLTAGPRAASRVNTESACSQNRRGRRGARRVAACMAERVGFEPTLEFPLNTLSKRAPSATRS